MRLIRLPRKIHLRLLGSVSAVVVIAIAAAVLVKGASREAATNINRGPASDYVNLENYVDAGELARDDEAMDDAGEEKLANAGRLHRSGESFGGASVRTGRSDVVFTPAAKPDVDVNEVYRRAGIMGQRRARRVIFHEAAFLAGAKAGGRERLVDLPLFDDYKPRVKLLAASPFSANDGIHTGQLVHDPSSQVHLFVENGQISGEIEATGHKFRIVNVGGSETLIIEDEP